MKEFKNSRGKNFFILNNPKQLHRSIFVSRKVIAMTLPPMNNNVIIQGLGRTETGTLQTIIGYSLPKTELEI